MKYVVVLYDGMADYPVPALGGKTPMMVAKKPNFDRMAKHGTVGLVRTVAPGMGIKLSDTDVALRCNLVTLSDEEDYSEKTMVDYCAGDISSEEAAEIINTVEEKLGNDIFAFYSGVSYRHCLVWHGGKTEIGKLTPPHDISGRKIGGYLNKNPDAAGLLELMEKSCEILKDHPVNLKRISEGKRPANAIWLWGQGSRPSLPSFEKLYGVKGSVISAVDLLKGIGICAGMNTPDVEGATGYIDTNFEGKAQKAVEELENGSDFVYIHIEAPDECGHRNEPENKVKAIELIDSRVLPIVLEALEKYDDYKVMILPDHPTPIVTGTHASDPVPFMIYHKKDEKDSGVDSINEETASKTGIFIEEGPSLMGRFLSK